MNDPFDTPGADEEIPRDHFSRPLIVPPGGGKPTAYTRCTTYVGCIEDLWNLHRWDERNVILGLADRPDLVLAASAHRDDKDKLNEIVAAAKEAAKAKAAAEVGTSLHKLCERLDRGQILGVVPAAYEGDIAAYERATACLEMVDIERFAVLDDLKIGGTPDRKVRHKDGWFIADIKTGSIEYGALKISMQLAVYAHSEWYDPTTFERTPVDVDQERAIVIHLPAGQGRCEFHWVDIAAGWEAVQVATEVRAWRARKGLFKPFTTTPDLPALIGHAASVDALRALWTTYQDVWTDDLTVLANTRKAELTASAA